MWRSASPRKSACRIPTPLDRERLDCSQGRAGRVGATLLAVLAVVAAGGAAWAARQFWPKPAESYLTHSIRRGDLRVTVTEQGALESSDNVEIKCRVRGFSMVTWIVPGGTIVQPGDDLVRLDTKVIEEQLSLTKTNTFQATATLEETRANLEKAEIAVDAYVSGRYRSQLQLLEQQCTTAETNLRTSEKMLSQSKQMFRRGYVNRLDVAGNEFTVKQARLELEVKQKEIEVLKRYTKQMQLETLQGNLRAAQAKLKSDEAALKMETSRQKRAEQELADCVIRAQQPGLVIYPSAAAWKNAPDVAEGVRVRKDQVLLLMPDLSQMQVKVGVHESVVDRVQPGMPAVVSLGDQTLSAEVDTVAAVTRPAGWWTGNVVKYDTILKLPESEGLKPGMTAEVDIVLAEHADVLLAPVAAVVQTESGDYCWVQTTTGVERRRLELGDTDDVYLVVEGGLTEGDEVVLNPTAHIEQAKQAALEVGGVVDRKSELQRTYQEQGAE